MRRLPAPDGQGHGRVGQRAGVAAGMHAIRSLLSSSSRATTRPAASAATAFLEFVRRHPGVGLLFVDDGSTDGTAEVHARTGARPRRQPSPRCGWSATRARPRRCGGASSRRWRSSPALVGFWDADLATPLDAVDDFLDVAAKRPDVEVILGSRVLLMGRDIRRKASRHYLGRVFATAASLTLGIPVYDTQCGAKVFRTTSALSPSASREPFRSRGSSTSRSSRATWTSR